MLDGLDLAESYRRDGDEARLAAFRAAITDDAEYSVSVIEC
jgi:hypothetical protein